MSGAELEIRRRIEERDRITFAEFMELALFWPDGGYYSSPDNIGPRGDFYTAPGAHPVFGALVCLQTFQMWQLIGRPESFWLVEMGAGTGLLCHDVASYSPYISRDFADSLRYLCLDRFASPGVEAELPDDTVARVQRIASSGLSLKGVTGCLLSNELIDSFPVHRLTLSDGELKEVYVTLKGGELTEVLDVPSTPALGKRLGSLDIALVEGAHAEVNLPALAWLEEAAAALETGFLLTIDYGHSAAELYSRRQGTVTCYYNHTQVDSLYRRVGEQDITAQVDFTSLEEVGRSLEFEHLGTVTQREFLQNLGIGQLIARLSLEGLGQPEADANRLGMLELIRPGGMGEFKVLAQGVGVGTPPLWGIEPSQEVGDLLKEAPFPLRTRNHMPLLESRYPHLAFDWEELLR